MTISPARRLTPFTWTVHRTDDLARYISYEAALPEGVTVESATVQWATRRNGVPVDASAQFSATVEVDPAAVAAPGGGTRGGDGTILVRVSPPDDLPRRVYEFLLTLALSNEETVTWGGEDDYRDWGQQASS